MSGYIIYIFYTVRLQSIEFLQCGYFVAVVVFNVVYYITLVKAYMLYAVNICLKQILTESGFVCKYFKLEK